MRKTTRIDLHVHTRGSDGTGTPEQIAVGALKAGLDGLVITDHHLTYTAEGLEVARACREAGLTVFHGCECSTAQGHLLVYGVNIEDQNFLRYPGMQDVIRRVNKAGGVCVPAHPYVGYHRRLGDHIHKLKGIRAIETANGQCATGRQSANRMAVRTAQAKGLLTTGGSDAHHAFNVGMTYTEFQGVITNECEFLVALRRGQFHAVTSRKRVTDRVRSYTRPGYFEQLARQSSVLDLDRTDDSRQVRDDGSDPQHNGPDTPVH